MRGVPDPVDRWRVRGGTGDWAGWGSYREGPALVRLDNGAWRIFFDGYGDGSYYCSGSFDIL
jgi:hypothetical protein